MERRAHLIDCNAIRCTVHLSTRHTFLRGPVLPGLHIAYLYRSHPHPALPRKKLQTMPTDLLDLPSELIEHILALLAHQDASSLPARRQTCRALNATIAQSQLVRYIERAALLGVYDPLVSVSDVEAEAGAGADADGAPMMTMTMVASMTIPERAAALEAWDEAWGALDDILCTRKPDLRFAMPSRDELRTGRTAEVASGAGSAANATTATTTTTTTTTASTRVAAAVANSNGPVLPVLPVPVLELELDQQRWRAEEEDDEDEDEDDWHCHFSFGPWFVAAAREGPGVRAGYSFLDVHRSLGGGAGGAGAGRGVAEGPEPEAGASCEGNKNEGEEEEESPSWTTINVPVRNIVVFALSTELDLAVAISCVSPPFKSFFSFGFVLTLIARQKLYCSARVKREEGSNTITSHLEVRPLRFGDGMPHPCAEVPTIRLSATGASAHNMAQTQLLGDYLLLWIGGPHEEDYSLCKLYLIAWKRGSVMLVSSESCSEETNPLASSL